MGLVRQLKIINIKEIISEDDLYNCGSPNLRKFLEENGLDYISDYKLKRNNKTIWQFLKCDELSKLLTIWSNNKK